MSNAVKRPQVALLGMWILCQEWMLAVEQALERRAKESHQADMLQAFTRHGNLDALPKIIELQPLTGPDVVEYIRQADEARAAAASWARNGFDAVLTPYLSSQGGSWTLGLVQTMRQASALLSADMESPQLTALRRDVAERASWLAGVHECFPRGDAEPVTAEPVEAEPVTEDREGRVKAYLAANIEATLDNAHTKTGVPRATISRMKCWKDHNEAKKTRRDAKRQVKTTQLDDAMLAVVPSPVEEPAAVMDRAEQVDRVWQEHATEHQKKWLNRLFRREPHAKQLLQSNLVHAHEQFARAKPDQRVDLVQMMVDQFLSEQCPDDYFPEEVG